MLGELDGDAAHAAHFVVAGGDRHANAQLFEHALLQPLQFLQTLHVGQTLEQAVFLVAGEQQDAHVGARCFQQLVPPTGAGAGWAGLANRRLAVHGA